MKRIIFALFGFFAFSLFHVAAAESLNGGAKFYDLSKPEVQRDIKDLLKNHLKGVKKIPGTGMTLVEVDDHVLLMSMSGRFVVNVDGLEIQDMWNGTTIRGIDDMANIDRVDLNRMGINLNELPTFHLGRANAPEVTVFVDPRCPYCKQLLAQAAKLTNEYQFRIIVVPFLGDESARIAENLVCTLDKDVATKAIVEGNYQNLSPTPDCNGKPALQKGLIVAKVLDIQSVPFMISPSHAMFKGRPADLSKWLRADKESAATQENSKKAVKPTAKK